MALDTTDPSTLAARATCFNCTVPPGYQLALQTYLLAVIAGVDTSSAGVQALVNNATCFQSCIPMGMEIAVQNYILANLASSS